MDLPSEYALRGAFTKKLNLYVLVASEKAEGKRLTDWRNFRAVRHVVGVYGSRKLILPMSTKKATRESYLTNRLFVFLCLARRAPCFPPIIISSP